MTTNKVKCGQGKCPFTDEFCMSGDCPYDHDVLKKQKKINISEGNVKEDDINVANNVAQRNLQDLTEQWKKGKIKKAKYWVKYRNGNIDIWELSEGIPIESKPEIIEVLAPVLSFEEWQQMKAFCEEFNALEVAEENQKLKELLEACKRVITEDIVFNHKGDIPYSYVKILSRIDEVLK